MGDSERCRSATIFRGEHGANRRASNRRRNESRYHEEDGFSDDICT